MSSSNTQHWSPEQYARHARFVSTLGVPVIDLLSPKRGESILDLGCGDGVLTMKLMERGCTVVGVDSSAEMVAAAKLLGLNVHVIDEESLRFTSEFDAVFSNAALHWMKDPKNVIAGVWRSLKPGGRFVGEFGGYGNVATIVRAIESTFSSRGWQSPVRGFSLVSRNIEGFLKPVALRYSTLLLFPAQLSCPET
jgi:trans-aconitate methyltransferase